MILSLHMPSAVKTISPLPQVIGVREFTRDLPRVTARLKKSNLPLLVMSRNKPEMIALGPSTYNDFAQWLEDRHDAALLEKVMKERSGSKSIPWRLAKKLVENAV